MYKNFRIYATDNGTFIVRADTKRFGKQAIVFESYSSKECWRWISENYRNKDGKRITNSRWVGKVYCEAYSTLNVPNNPWYKAN